MISATTKKEPKPGFLCPISYEIMLDPVLLSSSGHTYERAAIETWLEKEGTDPQTRTAASVHQLIPNRALKDTIHHWLKKDPQGSEADLWAAVKTYDKKALDRCVLLGVNLAATDKEGNTLLHWAAREGVIGIVKYLVDKGASLEAKNNYSSTPLHWAVENGHTKIAKYLIDKGASLEAQDQEEKTPLHVATENGYTEIAKYLIDKKAPLEAKDDCGYTPLHEAAKEGHTDIAKYLVDKGASIAAKTNYDRTPLHVAVYNESTDTAKYLVDNGASVDAKDDKGQTPLHHATKREYTEIGKYLVYMGADQTLRNNKGLTPQQVATTTLAEAMTSWPVATELPANRLTTELLQLRARLAEKDQQLTTQAEQMTSLASQLEMLLNWKKDVEQQLTKSAHSATFFSNNTQTSNKDRRSIQEETSSRFSYRNY